MAKSSIRNTFLYTPCCCPVGKQLEQQQQQVGSRKAARKGKSYKTPRRIQYLAKPRKPKRKYQPQPVQRYTTQRQVSRPYDEPYASKRLQQLALPLARKLVAAQDEYRRFISRGQQEQLEKRIKKSIFTVYSRLANVQLPDLGELKGMTTDEWQKHREWLVRNARPKTRPPSEQPKRAQKPLAALLNRIESLAAPKSTRPKFTGKERPVPAVSPAAKKAIPSEHLQKLAEPISRRWRAKGPLVEDTSIPENVLKAQASSRIVQLAVAKRYDNVRNEYRDNPFTVEPNALKAKASDRTLELAKPKKVKK